MNRVEEQIEAALRKLTLREQHVLRTKFGFLNGMQPARSDRIQIDSMHGQRVEAHALRKLRAAATDFASQHDQVNGKALLAALRRVS